ncbi:MAG: right-handed parallel beta-helix repeat-containing protein [Chloroflexi bacterium]|nr:right-handed parallel beta-helix repeat-containing protein [Chloroflexota bacterium]
MTATRPTTTAATVSFDSATFTFSGFDNATAVTFECSLDGAPYTACVSPYTVTGLSLGTHSFAVRGRDWSSNVDPTPATATWTVIAAAPGVPPETTIVSGPDGATPSSSATFTFAANEPGVTFMCSLDGAAAAVCTSPQTYIGLLPGAHTFEVYAVDSENLADTTPATYAWTITPAPAAATVSCGQTLTQSTLVSNDLLDCLGDGLIIGADGITLDLNGHIIDGTGLGVGILNNGFEHVVITNGTVQEFDYGVQLNAGADGNVVSVLTLQNNQVGAVQLAAADNAVVRHNIITLNTQGLELSGSTTGALVKDNTFIDNPGNAIYLLGVSGNRVEGNYATGSSGSGVALEGPAITRLLAIRLLPAVTGVLPSSSLPTTTASKPTSPWTAARRASRSPNQPATSWWATRPRTTAAAVLAWNCPTTTCYSPTMCASTRAASTLPAPAATASRPTTPAARVAVVSNWPTSRWTTRSSPTPSSATAAKASTSAMWPRSVRVI